MILLVDVEANVKNLSNEIAKRETKAREVLDLIEYRKNSHSVRDAALTLKMPKSTAFDRIKTFENLEIDEKTYDYFNSQNGIIVLNRIINSITFVGHHVCNLGARSIEMILRLAGLDRFIASSHTYLTEQSREMQKLILAFGEEEQARLAQDMLPKKITVLEDETWLDKMYLIAMDADSRYIFLEESSEKRDSNTWFSAMAKAIAPLNVQIVQVTSDEAKALVHHAEVLLGAHHSPDLFHVQQEISRKLGSAIGKILKKSETKVRELKLELAAVDKQKSEHIKSRLEQAQKDLDNAESLYSRYKTSLQGISKDYHPVNLQTGKIQSAGEVEALLRSRFKELYSIAKDAGVGDYCFKGIEKAERVVPLMISTISFVQGEWQRLITALNLASNDAWQVRNRILTALYLAKRAQKEKIKKDKQAMNKLSQELLAAAWSTSLGLGLKSVSKKSDLLRICQDAVNLFQRSSSPLEGRNGALSQRFGAKRGLSTLQLRTQTVLANYYLRSFDGTTAAERFFEKKPRSLVEWVFERMPLFALSRKSTRSPLQMAS